MAGDITALGYVIKACAYLECVRWKVREREEQGSSVVPSEVNCDCTTCTMYVKVHVGRAVRIVAMRCQPLT